MPQGLYEEFLEEQRKKGAKAAPTQEQIQRIISESAKRGRKVTEEEVRARLKARGQ